MSSVSLSKNKNKLYSSVLKGVLTATSITLVAILIFAAILSLRFISVPDSFILPTNQVIKIVSIFFGVKAALKHNSEKGLIKGLLVGFFYTLLAFVLFSALSGNFIFNLSFINDALFGAILGAICGILVVNLKR